MINELKFSGVVAGIKTKQDARDVGLVVSEVPANVVGMFTTNQVQAAPVVWSKQQIKSGTLRALLVNSGNANACTGAQGMRDVKKSVQLLSKKLKISSKEILVCSTGKIGVPLPMEKLFVGINDACSQLSEENFKNFNESIMTTDQFPKVWQKEILLGKKSFHIMACAKGAGMIEPNMATMLAFVFTDLALPISFMQKMFKVVVNKSFNSITVDGDRSTNDTALWISVPQVQLSRAELLRYQKKIQEELLAACYELARLMVADGEGATHVVKIHIKHASSEVVAKRLAYAVARSLLVKTAFFGQDPNWGRIMSALGQCDATVVPHKIDIYFNDLKVVGKGCAVKQDIEEQAHNIMKNKDYSVIVDLHMGSKEAYVLTSDLTYDYVKLNSEYRT